jgi:hypothetical protein
MSAHELQNLAKFAEMLGWKVHDRRHGGFELISPSVHGKQIIVLPGGGQANESRMLGWIRKILRYGDLKGKSIEQIAQEVTYNLAGKIRLAAATNAPDMGDELTPEELPAEKAPVEEVPTLAPALTIVDERPWLAHNGIGSRGIGMSYESQAVVERLWSNGHIDYRCVGCDYFRDVPRSVKSHYGARSGRDENHPKIDMAQRGPFVEDPSYTEPAWHKSVEEPVHRLRKELQKALAEVWEQIASNQYERLDLATVLAEVMVRNRREAGQEAEPVAPTPLTPEEKIRRIQILLGDEDRITKLEETVRKSTHELEESQRAVEEMRVKWTTLRSLMDD